mmetsp:Transcript_12779/g.15454  ORF Transcript_12779/g.15454 Transcript_12779/m.15454 type:complete len:92 (-) Transcript_12779:37-312(-)
MLTPPCTDGAAIPPWLGAEVCPKPGSPPNLLLVPVVFPYFCPAAGLPAVVPKPSFTGIGFFVVLAGCPEGTDVRGGVVVLGGICWGAIDGG